MSDELRPEYDLKSLRVRRLGPDRKNFAGTTVRLEPDLAAAFPTADAVNEALRLLLNLMRDNPELAATHQSVSRATDEP